MGRKGDSPHLCVAPEGPFRQMGLSPFRHAGPPDTEGGDQSPHSKGQVRIFIRDDGPGLKPEERRHVFDPFYSARQAGRGIGLGLLEGLADHHEPRRPHRGLQRTRPRRYVHHHAHDCRRRQFQEAGGFFGNRVLPTRRVTPIRSK